MMNIEYFFVYGSLRTIEGHPMHNYMRAFCDRIGDASVGGIKVDVGKESTGTERRAGLQPSSNPDERVEGELYRIHDEASDELFAVLDRYQGCSEDDPEPHEYFRHRQDVTLLEDRSEKQEPSADKEAYEAWVYLYNG